MASTLTAMTAEEWQTWCGLTGLLPARRSVRMVDLIITARVPGRHDHLLINPRGLLFECLPTDCPPRLAVPSSLHEALLPMRFASRNQMHSAGGRRTTHSARTVGAGV
jgi:hypothetical protein